MNTYGYILEYISKSQNFDHIHYFLYPEDKLLQIMKNLQESTQYIIYCVMRTELFHSL